MSPADDRPVNPESQAGKTDSSNGQWKPHRVRAGSYNWEGVQPPTDHDVHRKHVEPWLAALLQSEHVNLLVGSGLTTAIATLAGTPAVDMKTSTFACDLADDTPCALDMGGFGDLFQVQHECRVEVGVARSLAPHWAREQQCEEERSHGRQIA